MVDVQFFDARGRETWIVGLLPDEALSVVNNCRWETGALLFLWTAGGSRKQIARYTVVRGGRIAKGRLAQRASRS
jgi:hypothetical protein